jgi:hypothetical protein
VNDPDSPKLTIAIPIHGAERWIPGIVEIVRQAPEWSRVVISDASGLDRAAERLAGLFRGDPSVEVIERSDRLDWVSHCNLLLDEAETEYFCWFPQDDLPISDRYFERLIEPLDRDPEVAVAVPTIFCVLGRGRTRRRPEFLERFKTGLRGDRSQAGIHHREGSDGRDSLGVIWKGAFRRSLGRPMPQTGSGVASDIGWSFSMLLAGRIDEVPDALYLKRMHRQSATYLNDSTKGEQFRESLIGEIEARMPESGGDREAALALLDQIIESQTLMMEGRPGFVGKVIRRLVNEPRPYFE